MLKEIKTKWVEALKSGKFVHSKGYLKEEVTDGSWKEIRHCCLGVLCEILGIPSSKTNSPTDNYFLFNGERNYLPEEVLSKTKLTWNQQNNLVYINDSPLTVGYKKQIEAIEAIPEED